MRKVGIGAAARVIGLLAIGAAIVATDLHLRHSGISPADHSDARAAAPSDPLAHELLRCRAIGIKAKDDAACDATWAENRRRFFAPLTERPSALAPPSTTGQPK